MTNPQKTISAIVGSKNPVKVAACRLTLERYFSDAKVICEGVEAPSKVAEQPLTESETLAGAQNRVEFCLENYDADFYMAMEGGVDNFDYGAATFAYVVIADRHIKQVGRTANLPIPNAVYDALLSGEELGPLMDKLFGTSNIKQKGGAIGLLTNGIETRTSNYVQALTLAMARFVHVDRFNA